jgi:hypothetical protein
MLVCADGGSIRGGGASADDDSMPCSPSSSSLA